MAPHRLAYMMVRTMRDFRLPIVLHLMGAMICAEMSMIGQQAGIILLIEFCGEDHGTLIIPIITCIPGSVAAPSPARPTPTITSVSAA